MANTEATTAKEYVSEDGYYLIPVTWEVNSTVRVKGNNLHDAIERFKRVANDIPLDTNNEYVDGSYRIEDDSDEHMIAAQAYYPIGSYVIDENDNIS